MRKWWEMGREYDGSEIKIEKLPLALICIGVVMAIVGLLIL